MLKVAPIDDPSEVREVTEQNWENWTDAPGITGGKEAGRGKIYKVVSDADIVAASAPRRPIVPAPVPPEVQNIQAGLGPDGQPKDKVPEPVKVDEVKAAPEPVAKVQPVNKGGRPRR